MATFLTQNDRKPFQAKGPVRVRPANPAGTKRDGDQEVEVADPPRKDGSRLLIEVDRHRQEQAEGNEERHATRERDPRQVVVELGERGRPMTAGTPPSSQKIVAVRKAIGAAPATPITQYRRIGVRCAMPRIRSTISIRIGISATQNQLNRIML